MALGSAFERENGYEVLPAEPYMPPETRYAVNGTVKTLMAKDGGDAEPALTGGPAKALSRHGQPVDRKHRSAA